MSWEFVRLEPDEESDGAVVTLRFERPPMNPLDTQLQSEIRDAAGQLAADRAVRAVVVYGGPKVFAAGAD
ncbi:MAG TPA: enoyl-CoA hydratase-related protein, partial [Mycobacteriales bacterium]